MIIKENTSPTEPKEKKFPAPKKTAYEAFRDIQQLMKVKKSRYNSFSKFNYRSVEDIYEAWKALDVQFLLTISDEVIEVSGRPFVQATATVKDLYGNVIETSSAQAELGIGKAGMSTEQATGSASSYARKYALNGLFLLDDADDPDASTGSKGKTKEPKDITAGEAMDKIRVAKVKELQDLIRGDASKTAKATAVLAGRSIMKLTVNEIDEIINTVR